MSLAGPRLDRPSAIGDEGRPRATSLGVATLVVVALASAGGHVLGWLSLLPSVATVVGLTVAGAALTDRDGFVELLVGHALLVPFGSMLALLVIAAPLLSPSGLAVSGFSIALFGVALGWADVGNDAGLKRATTASVQTYGAVLGGAVVLALVACVGVVVWALLSLLTEQSAPALSAVGFAFVAACSAIAVWLALRAVPFRQLAPRERRPAVERRVRTGSRLAALAALGALGLCGAGVVLWSGGWTGAVTGRLPIVADALSLLSDRLLVGPVAAIGGLSLFVGAVATLIRLATRHVGATSARRLAAAVVGTGLATVGSLLLLYILAAMVSAAVVPPGAVLVVVVTFVAPVALVSFGASLVVGIGLGVLPDRAAGPAIAATGLVVAAIGLRDGPSALVFACVAGAVLVWDVSTFGLGVTAELGHIPETRRLELFHGLLGVGVAIGAVLVAVGFDLLRTSLLVDVGGAGALVAVAVGGLILLIPLRG